MFGYRCMVSTYPDCEVITLTSIADKLSALSALLTALENLDSMCAAISDAYDTSLQTDDYEKWTEES